MNFEPTEQVTLFKFSDSVQLKSHKYSPSIVLLFCFLQYKNNK